jgi:hypothetical protein
MKENSDDDSPQFKSEQLEIAETSETSKNTKEINNTTNILEKNVKEEALIVSNGN